MKIKNKPKRKINKARRKNKQNIKIRKSPIKMIIKRAKNQSKKRAHRKKNKNNQRMKTIRIKRIIKRTKDRKKLKTRNNRKNHKYLKRK